MIFRECGIGYKQRAFHSKGIKITENGDEKTSAPMRFSHESVSKETALVSGWRRAMCKAQANSNCDVRGTRHSGSVAHTAEND